jgi:hypothetical protein
VHPEDPRYQVRPSSVLRPPSPHDSRSHRVDTRRVRVCVRTSSDGGPFIRSPASSYPSSRTPFSLIASWEPAS